MSLAETTSHAALDKFHPCTRQWFAEAFEAPTDGQQAAWPHLAAAKSVLLLAPTGSGKTLAAFLAAVDRLMFGRREEEPQGVRVLYISPLKALGVDVDRNLRPPIAGIRAVAGREGVEHRVPTVGVRTGDTPQRERAEQVRRPPDILITTPESLYLLLTSKASQTLRHVETVIVDEIHAMVASKRGAHLFLSLERLERLRRAEEPDRAPLQRIGLSATQRPLDEVGRLLGGGEATADTDHPPQPRPVEIVDASRRKQLNLQVEVPVEDLARLGEVEEVPSGPAAAGPAIPSIWPSIYPRLVELIRGHRSTMIFVNSRRLAERLSAAINQHAEEEIAQAHHGSVAKSRRRTIEDRLKRGQLPAIVATSSLELGIDMGAVDLVIQIEAPPSIASGLQRIGRSGHRVGEPSSGVIFPKYRGDLLACGAATARMMTGEVEETFYPRSPLDVLAQQIVAATAMETLHVDDLYALVRGAAPFFDLPRNSFEGVLDLLAGRYPSDDFAELRPRITWDRLAGTITARQGARRLAVLNAGTIPDRGLYGVFLATGEEGGARVGELDEEMVFELQAGDVFLLGASSWRVANINRDRVMVTPAPGEPGRMPFWRGDGPGRPLEFGRAIGRLTRELAATDAESSAARLQGDHGLDQRASRNLVNYVRDQVEATGEPPSDRTIVVESFLDEIGDWRTVILSPLGTRIHAPWAMAVTAHLREESGLEVDMMWSDDGIVFRLPEADEPPPTDVFFPRPGEIEDRIVRQLGATAMFAARFRENAARALLLPRQRPNRRTPLWLQRRRSADLLAVAARFESFPILLETYRECLRDVFDMPGLIQVLSDVESRAVGVHAVQTQSASPFAAALLFNYTGQFIYDGDAPLAERRAQALVLDHAQLQELLGSADLRELLDVEVIDEVALELQRLGEYRLKHADAIHDLLLNLGDQTPEELAARCDAEVVESGQLVAWLEELVAARRVIEVRIGGDARLAAAEDAARLRDALGVVPPIGLPTELLEPVADPLGDLVSRFARTHAPFKAEDAARRLGLGEAPVLEPLRRLAERGRVVEGEFRPGGRGREWCDSEVLRTLKRRSLARIRKQIEPVEKHALGRFLPDWQGVTRPRRGLDAVLDVIEQLQGAAVPASVLESEVLPSRIADFQPSYLDELCAAGEIVWRGEESLGTSDGRVAVYLTDDYPRLTSRSVVEEDGLPGQVYRLLATGGAQFFDELQRQLQAFNRDLLDALWQLVWAGAVTNDTLAPLRSLRGANESKSSRRGRRQFRSRRRKLPGTEGRWSLLPASPDDVTTTERQAAVAQQLVHRCGIVTRAAASRENLTGGFAGVYPVLKTLEESGKVRRGYFVEGLGGAQFAAPGADERLRQRRDVDESPQTLILATTDPANIYGAAVPFPETDEEVGRPQRVAGARVILRDGRLIGYLGRTGQNLLTFLPAEDPGRSAAAEALAEALAGLAGPRRGVLLAKIDGQHAGESSLKPSLIDAGFVETSKGLMHRRTERG